MRFVRTRSSSVSHKDNEQSTRVLSLQWRPTCIWSRQQAEWSVIVSLPTHVLRKLMLLYLRRLRDRSGRICLHLRATRRDVAGGVCFGLIKEVGFSENF